ncbi:MAG TPA: hypothetical protein VKG66_05420, partial [Steroidobacteraceae bacterium]|nr:hypothetical protein [Steroidobacteraceae bacterium]
MASECARIHRLGLPDRQRRQADRTMALEYTEFTICPLATLGVLHFDGPDAGAFLQGQLSCDTGELGGEQLLPAGWHNPHGRVLALLRVGLAGNERIVA